MIDFKWIYDVPRIGPYLRARKYKDVFELMPGEIAVDLGANVGKITERMARPGVIVYAFEPDPRAFQKLQERFKDRPEVICIPKAASDHAGRAPIYFHTEYAKDPITWSVASSLFREKGNVNQDTFVEVDVIDIARFILTLEKPISLMKIDIEGEEIRVLNKLIESGLYKRIKHIVVETHERLPFLKEPTARLKKTISSKGIKNIDLNWA